MLGLSCSMRNLVPWPRIKPEPPALEVWSLSHWTTRVSANSFLFFIGCTFSLRAAWSVVVTGHGEPPLAVILLSAVMTRQGLETFGGGGLLSFKPTTLSPVSDSVMLSVQSTMPFAQVAKCNPYSCFWNLFLLSPMKGNKLSPCWDGNFSSGLWGLSRQGWTLEILREWWGREELQVCLHVVVKVPPH